MLELQQPETRVTVMPSRLETFLAEHPLLLMEVAVLETLRRLPEVTLHPFLDHALLVEDVVGRAALSALYFDFIQIAEKTGVPLILGTPTWRANLERLAKAEVKIDLNAAGVRLMQAIRKHSGPYGEHILIGGLMGCKNDCYRPEQALTAEDAYEFHVWQVERLAAAGVDFLHAVTLPSVTEAIGIAAAMSAADQPYILSFVINRQGHVLDGTPLEEAIERIDSTCAQPPLGYAVNCSYPDFLDTEKMDQESMKRLVAFQANASGQDHAQLEASVLLQAEPVESWGQASLRLARNSGIKMLGGCCGTDLRHLEFLARHAQSFAKA